MSNHGFEEDDDFIMANDDAENEEETRISAMEVDEEGGIFCSCSCILRIEDRSGCETERAGPTVGNSGAVAAAETASLARR